MIEAPQELAERAQWVAWRYVTRVTPDGPARTKVPVNARTGTAASTTDPSTWSTYLDANAYLETGHADGIGYVLSEDDPYTGVDLDHCREADGAVATWAKAIVRRLSSYTEISPSGSGLRIFVRGELPPYGRHKGSIEVYCKARFLTITGDRYMAAPLLIADRQKELIEWHRDVFGERIKPATGGRTQVPSALADTELLIKAQSANNGSKFNALWNGDHSAYESESEADLALANYLAFYCGPDPSRIDALFRLSGLFRDKWERDDYRTWTINKALEGRTDFYDPNYRSSTRTSTFGVGGVTWPATPTAEPPPTESPWRTMEQVTQAGPEKLEQLVQRVLWRGRTHWFYSGPGAGKTIFMLALALHIGAGRPFHGLEVMQGATLIVEEDSPDSVIADYLLMLADIYDFDLTSLPVYFHRERGLRITDDATADRVRQWIDRAPTPPALFMIDACERVVPSEFFNSKELDPIARLFAANLADGITNVMIDHTRKPQPSGGEKVDPIELLYGGRTKSAISDVMLFLSGQVKNKALLTFPKFRGEAPAPIGVSFDSAQGFTLKLQKTQINDSQRAVMMVINNAFGKVLTAEEIAEQAKLQERTAQRALKSLVDLGWVERLGEARASRYQATTNAGGVLFDS